MDRVGTGRAAYLGLDVKPAGPVRPGDTLELTHYFEVNEPLGKDYAVIVELAAPGVPAPISTDAHRPIGGRAPTQLWKRGEIWADQHRIRVPPNARAPALEVLVGLSDSGQRATVEAPSQKSDGRDRIRAAMIPLDLSGAPAVDDGLPSVVVPRASGPITPDGKLDEPAWAKAPVLGFEDSMGRAGTISQKTELRLLWDDQYLYVGFTNDDIDITDPYQNRDDPIYDHETCEIFLMPNVIAPALGPYVELQASPKGIIFDAAFVARRQGMDKSFNAGQTVGTIIDGTLNEPTPDRRWISEWIVPWKNIRGVTAPPKAGDEWRLNAFRIEKHGSGKDQVGEYSAWSPPRVGDFHNTERFGRLRFGP
ncbi:MAG: carbohydrate-binding family 9-like protein [Myxococcota bacterium]